MGKIVISENITLDGVIQDPTGEDGIKSGGWFLQVGDKDHEDWAKVMTDEAMNAEAMLLGRRSDEYFATRWLTRTGAWADRLNTLPKYVVSSTITEPKWGTGTVLRGDPVQEVTTLRQKLAGEIIVNGSIQLVHTLLEHDLVDELRLAVYPVVAGAGERLFSQAGESMPLRLTGSRTLGESTAFLTYEPIRP